MRGTATILSKLDRFEAVAPRLGCDPLEVAFDRALAKITKAKSKDAAKKRRGSLG
jgi:hypothetical protein